METKEVSTQEQTPVSEDLIRNFPTFSSEEAMQTYYAQMYRFYKPDEPPCTTLGVGRLNALRKKMKQHVSLLQELSEHEWGQGIIEMQTTCSAYMMREGVATNKRLEISDKVSEMMAFLIHMAENRNLIKNQYAIMNLHYRNVCKLIEKHSSKHSA